MKPDPPVTPTGRCPVCGKPRGRGIPKTLSRQARTRLAAMLAADPWCSTVCCRIWHGCALPVTPAQAGQQARYAAELA